MLLSMKKNLKNHVIFLNFMQKSWKTYVWIYKDTIYEDLSTGQNSKFTNTFLFQNYCLYSLQSRKFVYVFQTTTSREEIKFKSICTLIMTSHPKQEILKIVLME